MTTIVVPSDSDIIAMCGWLTSHHSVYGVSHLIRVSHRCLRSRVASRTALPPW